MPKVFKKSADEMDEISEQKQNLIWTRTAVLLGIGVGLWGLIIYSITIGFRPSKSAVDSFEAIGVTLLIAGSAFFIGLLFGFLFGIPRAVQGTTPETPASNSTARPAISEDYIENKKRTRNYQVNTNLEQVSDWLTKILLGVGLTQIHQIQEIIGRISSLLSVNIGDPNSTKVVIAATIIYFLVCGFLFGYLITRLFLAGAFSQADMLIDQARTEISRLVDLDLNIENLSKEEKNILSQLVEKSNVESGIKLVDWFERGAPEHQALRSLRDKKLVRPKEGGKWSLGKTAEMTPIAKKSIGEIRLVLETSAKKEDKS